MTIFRTANLGSNFTGSYKKRVLYFRKRFKLNNLKKILFRTAPLTILSVLMK